jgi:hypothetical protein
MTIKKYSIYKFINKLTLPLLYHQKGNIFAKREDLLFTCQFDRFLDKIRMSIES